MSVPSILEPLAFPLRGSALIEASAGTGKTFTIAALYLRLVLGHGGAAAFPQALVPPQILVVTFTEAATKELRDRIRARLAEAADLFLEEPTSEACEPNGELLHDLRASYPPAEWPRCARTLRLAAEWMDEAAVSTIHGWCYRMLREHAFDSGSLFTQALEAQQDELFEEAVRDYWRSYFYPLEAEDVAKLAKRWTAPTPDSESGSRQKKDLANIVRKLLEQRAHLPAGEEPAQALAAARAERTAKLREYKAPWKQWADQLEGLLDAACAAKQVNGTKFKSSHYKPWFARLRTWAADDALAELDLGKGWARLTPQGLAEVWKAGQPPDHPALDDLRTLRERLQSLPTGEADVLCHATHWIAARLALEQERRAEMGFNDLLTRLDAALQGPNGARLANVIRTQFPVALIDEFQDTDPLQYRIFDAVYGVARNAQDGAVVLIGDPKQAIYAFRGADIHTYLAARRDTEGRHATLGTNFRSTQDMVAAVNQFFGQAEERAAGKGAFLFRKEGDNPLPFVRVGAQGRKQRWVVEGAPAPALTCWVQDEGGAPANNAYVQSMAGAAAGEIVRLLKLGQDRKAGFEHDGVLKPLQPGDIAVLVNTGREARAVRQALAALGVRSVYLSDQDSVFASAVAADLQRLLQGCAEPEDDRVLRAALGTGLLGLSWSALDRLNQDDLHWEARVLQFRAYREQWRTQGVLPMLRRLLNDFEVPRRLLAAADERALTDVLHLAELLQEASALLDGEHALVRYLAEQRAEGNNAGEARLVRLESDAELLKVVTVHKSKGLEYPLVFLPFACACRPAKDTDLPLKWHDAEGRLQLALQAQSGLLPLVDEERLGEDLRKLYVALTRARYATWIGLAPVRDFERTAVGYLLAGAAPVAAGTLEDVVRASLGEGDAIAIAPAPAAGDEPYVASLAQTVLAPEPPLPAGPREPWWIASYSGLRIAPGAALEEGTAPVAEAVVPESATEATYRESLDDASDDVPADVAAEPGTLHDFPRGPSPGSFLHGLLEWAGREGFARVATSSAERDALIARRCQARGWQAWTVPLQQWLARWLATPLELSALTPGARVSPAQMRSVQVEMEFWFAASRVDTQKLDALVRRHVLPGAPRPALQPNQLNGMLKGFIDLVFAHEGRYYVADYKSNRLGAMEADYTPAAMRAEVLKHRYELQYTLYLFALHRLLRSRIPDYDYERDVGGAVYLFLRGHAAPGGGLHLERPGVALMDALDRLFSGAEVAA
ncbi:exodeoxyribonuclease V subunit beta [Ramlibacter sp. G-1-2-2]|uniref:RecBCD enzyme subunit RecB n=1 Tax=Ramlibacter agri TaxID=2728837 RepID=A0A848H8Q4_9BURK|nr:exodeoxyribonuclease V subunit beta [Ramlibacter agri]NML45780.1 exodeoxyribonuclease V subunit beta [Ramlibacter agri]